MNVIYEPTMTDKIKGLIEEATNSGKSIKEIELDYEESSQWVREHESARSIDGVRIVIFWEQ